MQRNLSKLKLAAYRQCPKRLWLEINRPELRIDAPGTEAVFRTGHEVGQIPQRIYDPDGLGAEVDVRADGVPVALERSRELLQGDGPVFEAGLATDGTLAFADVVLRIQGEEGAGWRIVEVKSSTSVKPYHEEDAAIQAYVASVAGIDLRGIAIAHVDTSRVFPGGSDSRGLLVERI